MSFYVTSAPSLFGTMLSSRLPTVVFLEDEAVSAIRAELQIFLLELPDYLSRLGRKREPV